MIRFKFYWISLRSGNFLSDDLKLGSPNYTVAPPTIAIGLNPSYANLAKLSIEI